MNTLVDTQIFEAKLELTEGKNGRVVARGPFAMADVPTANGRVYPRKLWEREIGKLEEKVKDRRCVGMLDHPSDGKTSLRGASHLITGLSFDGDTVVGEAEILPTPDGQILKALIESGVKVGVSSRGTGTTKPLGNGKQEVNDDYGLMTWDFVADPAAANSYPTFHTEQEHQLAPQMEDDMAKEMTEAKLRELYPDLVETIVQGEMENAVRSLEDEEAQQARMEQMIQDRLIKMISDERMGLEEQVRSDLMSDPSVGGARMVVENLVEMLRPYMLDEDAEAVVGNYEQALEEANEALVKALDDNETKDVIIDQLMTVSEDLGRRYFMMETLMMLEDAAISGRIISLVGNPSNYDTNDEFKEAFKGAIAAVRDDALAHETNDEEITKMEAENQHLKQALAESIEVGKALAVRAYAEKRLANHPLAPTVRRIMEEHSPTSQDEFEVMVEAVERNYEPSDEYGMVSSGLGGGLSHLTEGDEDMDDVLSEDFGGNGEGMFLGLNRREIQKKAGILSEDEDDNGKLPY